MSGRIARAALAVAAVATVATGFTGALTAATAPSATAAGSAHGCPSGAFCIYPQNAGWNGDRPSTILYSYGPHNLSDQVGHHYVLNNQYDDHGNPVIVELCTGSNGNGCDGGTTYYQWSRSTASGVSWGNPDLTPINSVLLTVFGP